ncbi:MAG: sugar transferase [Pirellulales bacterium]
MTHDSSTSAASVSAVGSRFNVSSSATHHETARVPRRSPSARTDVHRSREYVRQRMAANQPIVPAEGNRSLTYRATKRCVDSIGAIVLLVLFAPLLLAVLVVLTFTTGGRPLFIQRRVGYLGRQFPLIKFRTMLHDAVRLQARVTNEKDGPIFKNRTDPRITRIGRVLRKTSIDEMPQLVNVLLGHMSLVGPRPPVASEVLQYESWQRRRLAIKPGLTCLWQVSGRSDIGFVDWVRMDLWYVENQRLATDLELLIRTPWSVISCRGAY